MSLKKSRKNRQKFFRKVGINEERVLGLNQIHSHRILAPEEMKEYEFQGDGLVSNRDDFYLSVTAADCMPLALYDPVTDTRGMLHSGWKGTGILENAVLIMRNRFGSKVQDIITLAGPHIGSCCYRVDIERARIFESSWGKNSVVWRGYTPYLSLWESNLEIMKRIGLKKVIRIDACTVCSPVLGSYRREGAEDYTHMLALIGNFA